MNKSKLVMLCFNVCFAWLLFSAQQSFAQCTPTVFSVNQAPVVTGVPGAVNTTYRRSNVIPGVDIVFRIVSLNNGATLGVEDDAVGAPGVYLNAWQPTVNPLLANNGDGGITWDINFFVNGTSTPYRFNCLTVLAVDVDGNNTNIREYVEAINPYSYRAQSAGTFLTYTGGVNTLRTTATTTATIASIDSTQKQAMVEYRFVNTTGFRYTTGYTKTAGNTNRQFSLFFNTATNFPAPFTRFFNSDSDGSSSINEANDIDDDNDGIPDVTEYPAGYADPFADADADGLPNYQDATPGAIGNTFTDVNGDGINDNYDIDLDGLVNSIDLDADGDGIPDLVEAGGIDTNGDGLVDNVTDADGDGLRDTYDSNSGGVNIANLDTDGDGVPNFRDLDSDNDGIPDTIEAGATDANNDGRQDAPNDQDSDGLSDAVDGDVGNDGTAENTAGALIITSTVGGTAGRPASYPRANQDGTGLPNPYDLDADNDGILDVREAGFTDATNDGIADGTLGADGWSDTVDGLASLNLPNTDGSGRANYLDIDADNDGIVDNVEGQTTAGYIAPSGADADNDGIDNAYDNNDAAFAGGANNGIAPTNSDATDVADYIDLDADNDGYPDFFEGHDSDANNLPDAGSPAASGVSGGAADIDGDGLLDGYDNNTASVDATNGTNANSYPNLDGGTTERDWREIANTDASGPSNFTDIDDDNDGIPDLTENSGFDALADTDADGVLNYIDATPGVGQPAFVDTNNDGVNDFYDTDLDGIINSLDLDSDNDGIADLVEAGGIDTNGDGRVDIVTDTDGDGLVDTYDTSNGGVNIANFDTDGDGIANFKDLDSDNDGIPDVVEAGGTDANNDGKIDGYTDTDGDGLAQSVDGDTNNDGTAENTAGALLITGADTNGDGQPNSYPRANSDKMGLPNPYDLDADGDGILDTREAGLADTNNDGIADGTLGADGWSDTVDALVTLTLPNTDGRGPANYLDIDADDDGLTDNVEGQSTAGYLLPSGNDADNDGIDDVYDNDDAAFAGNASNGVTPYNHDGTDNPDYTDTDSDNDGVNDLKEGTGNTSATLTNTADADADGLVDQFDIFDLNTETANIANNVTIAGMGNGGSSTGPTPAGSNVLGNQTATGAPNRDWRNSLLVLPVTFINVTATISGSVTTVSWKVADEINVKEYIVERSTDGINYTAVGKVAYRNNNSAEQTYQFNDATVAASNAVVHYRIKQVDVDNKFTYSKVVTIRRGGEQNALKVLGNPVQNNQVLMQVTSNQPGNGTFMLLDMNGRVLSTTTQSLSKGDNSIRLAPQNGLLVKGTYIIRAIINGQLFTEKINVIQ